MEEEGPGEDIFDHDESGSGDAVENQQEQLEEVEDEIDPAVFAAYNV